jgi:hypothetical protein
MYFRSYPLHLFIDNVVLHLVEPDVVPPAPTKMADMWTTEETEVKSATEAQRKQAKASLGRGHFHAPTIAQRRPTATFCTT